MADQENVINYRWNNWADWPVTMIKKELKKRGQSGYSKLRKNELVVRITQVVKDERFVFFKKLPLELRDKIWREALPPRRAIHILGKAKLNPVTNMARIYIWAKNPGFQAVRNLMLVNAESLALVRRVYQQPGASLQHRFDDSGPQENEVDADIRTMKSYSDDDVFFFDIAAAVINTFSSFSPLFLKGVKFVGYEWKRFFSLCIRSIDVGEDPDWTLLLSLPSLEEIVVTGGKKGTVDIKVPIWGDDPPSTHVQRQIGDCDDGSDIRWVTRTGKPSDSLAKSMLTDFHAKLDKNKALEPLKKVRVVFMNFAQDPVVEPEAQQGTNETEGA